MLPQPDYVHDDSNFYGCAGLRLAFEPTKSPYYKVVRAGSNSSEIFVECNLISKTLRKIYDMGSNQVADDYLHGFIPPFAMYDMRSKKVDHKVYEFILIRSFSNITASASNSSKEEKEKGRNPYPIAAHLAIYLPRLRCATHQSGSDPVEINHPDLRQSVAIFVVITKQSLTTNVAIFEAAKVTFKRMGLWLCGVCFKTRTLCAKCRHGEGSDFVPPPDCGDGEVRFVLYDLAKPQVQSSPSVQLDHVNELVLDEHAGFTLPLLDILLSKRLRTVKSIPLKCRLRSNIECKSGIKRQRQEESIANAIQSWGIPSGSLQLVREALAEPSPSWSNINKENLDLGERNVKQCKRKIYDVYNTAAVRVLSFYGVAPYTDATLEDLKAKHPLKPAPSLPHIPIDHHLHLCSSHVTGQAGGGIRPIVVGTIWRHLVSKVSATMIGHSLDGYLNDPQFGVEVSGGVEAILHVVNWLIEDRGDDMGLSMLLVDFKNAFNLLDREVMLQEVVPGCAQGLVCLDDGTIIGDTLVVGEVLKVIIEDGPCRGLHLNVDKTKVFWPKEDPRSRFAGVFPPNIARPLHDVKLLGVPASADIDFSSELVMKRVAKSIKLMDVVAKINDPQCELLLLRACAALRFDLERIVIASGPGFSDWQWRLSTLPFAFGGLGVYSAGDVLNYAFLASRLQSAGLQTKLL
ncbi:hypothetical protein Tco_1034307 [Tanacetum coccineum]